MSQTQQTPQIEVLRSGHQSPFLFVCEHASNFIPDEYDNLGLPEDLRQSHIAWDPGAAMVTRFLSEKLNAPAVLGVASRLLYDCNRPPEAIDAVPSRSEVFDVPGNLDLTAEDIKARVDQFYLPFEAALKSELDKHGADIALVTIHSFTPVYKGQARAVEIGILHDTDSRFADTILMHASKHTSMKVERNQPYGAQDGVMHTLVEHGLGRGLLNVMIEIRNDLIATDADCEAAADMLAGLFSDALGSVTQINQAKQVTS
ncbi:N-formylglutamate amidohydrolase [Ahrensia kielensis]|uniref:N-formylglutamate amidohydrolase n=1 Tax=Ahrensia kielensis TaxID=76980 RepID=A0ABU9T593_9HYPH